MRSLRRWWQRGCGDPGKMEVPRRSSGDGRGCAAPRFARDGKGCAIVECVVEEGRGDWVWDSVAVGEGRGQPTMVMAIDDGARRRRGEVCYWCAGKARIRRRPKGGVVRLVLRGDNDHDVGSRYRRQPDVEDGGGMEDAGESVDVGSVV